MWHHSELEKVEGYNKIIGRMLVMSIRWVPECKWCGKRDMVKICSTRNDKKPNEVPANMSGVCKASPNDRHVAVWVEH